MTDQTVLTDSPNFQSFALDFNAAGDTLFAIDTVSGSLPDSFGTIDTVTGDFNLIAPIGGDLADVAVQTPTGLSLNPTDDTAYISSFSASLGLSTLYTIDVATGVTTEVATITTTIGGQEANLTVIDIAVDNNGQLFAYTINTDSLYSVDKATGEATLIGQAPIEFNPSGPQGMDFDPATNVLYVTIFDPNALGGPDDGSFGTWDTTTGVYNELVDLDAELAGMEIEFEFAIQAIASEDCVLGDVNGDGVVDLLDVAPFVEVVLAGSFQCEADINQDGVVDLLDIAPFVDLLIGG